MNCLGCSKRHYKLTELRKGQNISKTVKVMLANTSIFPVATCVSETEREKTN